MTDRELRIVAIVQARMGSTRLPGKTLCDIAGRPLLGHVLDRARSSRLITETIVATTSEPADQLIADFSAQNGVSCYRGSADDVLDRFYHAAREASANIIVRITGDDPFKDPNVNDLVIATLLEDPELDYVSNTMQPTFPEGLDVEVFTMDSLERAWNEAQLTSEREHVTPYLWKNPNRFRLKNVNNENDLSSFRWTIDYPEDLQFTREVYDRLSGKTMFGMHDILDLLRRTPELQAMNSGIARNAGYATSLERDKTTQLEIGIQ